MEQIKFLVYLDMDDTLVATSPFIQEYYGYPDFWIHTYYKSKNWKQLLKDAKLWMHLAWNCHLLKTLKPKIDYKELVDCANLLDSQPKILTALPEIFTRKAHHAKKWWINEYLPQIPPEHVFVTRSRLKHLYIKNNNNEIYVLIDDNPRVCARWTQAGGVALNIDAQNTKESIMHINEQLHLLLQLQQQGVDKKLIVKRFNMSEKNYQEHH